MAAAEPRATRARWQGGWWSGARPVPSPHCNERPADAAVTLAVIHSISLPPGRYGGDAVEHLFTGTLDCDAHPYFERLRGLRVSAHFFVRRNGEIVQFVDTGARAWHAGLSQWQGRAQCNDFSVGIELEGLEGDAFEPVQYRQLARLLRAIKRRHGIVDVAGHEHIAPGRKGDPGPRFDWPRLAQSLRGLGLAWPHEI